jgi:transposase
MKGKETNMTVARNVIHHLRMGHSKRQIHRDLKVHRSIIRELFQIASNYKWLNPELPMPNDEEISRLWKKQTTKALPHPLDAHKEQITKWIADGCSSIVIQQLLQGKFDVQAIRRYRKKYFPKIPEPVMVRTTFPGQEMEVDFGELGKFYDNNGVLKKIWVLSCRLRHSRKAYREIVTDQTLPTLLQGLVHAFEYFGGVPKICVLDNMKAAIIKSTIDNDKINRSFQDLAEHYQFMISPCLPYTPEHKGGVEGDIKYTKNNFLPFFRAKQKEQGVEIAKISDLAIAIAEWNNEIADHRLIHGVGRSPCEIFRSEEAFSLQSLPKTRWELTSWHRCQVQREWRIMVLNAYYSVPCQLISKTVDVSVTNTIVRIFYEHREVAIHKRATKKWEYQRKSEHAPPFHEAVLQCTREGLLSLAEEIGPHTHKLTQAILSNPKVDKLKPVRHLLRLAEKYSKERLEKACERANHFKMHSYASVKNILESKLDNKNAVETPVNKVIPLTRPRFARNSQDYKSDFSKETLEEQLERRHPFSRHGNGMARNIFDMLRDDALMDEYIEEKRKISPGFLNNREGHGYFVLPTKDPS